MKRITATLLALSICCIGPLGCDTPNEGDEATATSADWTASISTLDATGEGGVEVKTADTEDFTPWRGGQPIPPGSTVRTTPTARASISISEGAELTMNHSTEVVLASNDKVEVLSGQAVLEPVGGADDFELTAPGGKVVLHGGKVGVVTAEGRSTFTVSRGVVEMQHGKESFEARAGDEIVLKDGHAPLISTAPDLGRSLGWAYLAKADAQSEALPDVPRGLGKLVGKTPGGEAEHRLDLVDHEVKVTIRGNLAYTEITERFRNPVSETLEGVYRFPLPSDARINRLALKVGNKIMEGEFLETARAERIWRDVIDQWRDPAMLKWKEGNTFELRIFPIDPRQTREVTIGYVQRLEPNATGYTYNYPMPVDRAGLIPAEKFTFAADLYGHDATQVLDVLGYPAQVEATATNDDKALAKIRFEEKDFIARGDLSIRFGRNDVQGMRSYAFAERAGEDAYAVVVLRPDLPASPQIRPRDFVVVVDRSLSTTGAALQLQQRLAGHLIREMDALDRVAVIACDSTCEPAGKPAFELATPAAADAVEDALMAMSAGGASYPVEAVRVAAQLFAKRGDGEGRQAHVIFMTDGVASIGELRPGKLSDAVGRVLAPYAARMSVVDVGGNADALALEALATAGHGRVVPLDPMLSAPGQALEILGHHYRQILETPRVELPGGLTPAAAMPTAIAAGDELVLAFRYSGAPKGDVKLTGVVDGKPHAVNFDLALPNSPGTQNKFVPGEWAAQRINALELDAGDHEREIVKLSKRYGVLSRYTTLLALESREMMDEFGVRKRNRTQWTGSEVDDESADAEPMDDSTRSKRPARTTTRKPRKKSKSYAPSLKGSSSGRGMSSDLAFDGDQMAQPRPAPRESAPSKPAALDPFFEEPPRFQQPPPRHYAMPPRAVRRVHFDPATPTSDWEQKNVERRRKQLASDENNRTKRMRLIRAQIRAAMFDGAKRETDAWLSVNPMDPEAIVQRAQLHALDGEIDKFYLRLISAADAAPRGRWLQTRIAAAAKAQSDEPMSCAMEVALEATAKAEPKNPRDILSCPMTTVTETWFGGAGRAHVPLATDDTRLSGDVVIELSGSGDWDIMVLEPSGRPLWWGSQRRNIKVANVVGASVTERLAIPRLGSGVYSVYAVPRAGSAGDALMVQVKGATTRSFQVTAGSAQPFEIGQLEYRYR